MKITITIRINDKIVNFCKKVYKKRQVVLPVLLCVLGFAIPVYVTGENTSYDPISIPYQFQKGDKIDAEHLNDNFQVLHNKILEIKNTYIPNINDYIDQTQNELSNQSADMDSNLETLETGLIPKGMIVMYNGTADSIPVGWCLCDGRECGTDDNDNAIYTPDLRDKFIVGAETDDTSNTSLFYQGKNVSQHHSHEMRHRHIGTSDYSGAEHKHLWLARSSTDWWAYYIADLDQVSNLNMFSDGNGGSGSGSTLFHMGSSIDENLFTSSGGDHQHQIDITSSTGLKTEQPIGEPLPPYHALYYIMKK